MYDQLNRNRICGYDVVFVHGSYTFIHSFIYSHLLSAWPAVLSTGDAVLSKAELLPSGRLILVFIIYDYRLTQILSPRIIIYS